MRYRIQIEQLLGATLCVVTEVSSNRGRTSMSTKLYTIEGDVMDHGGLVEVLGELQRLIGESTP